MKFGPTRLAFAAMTAAFCLLAQQRPAGASPLPGAVTTAALPARPSPTQPSLPTYQDPDAPLEARVDDLFGRLTQDEKLGLLAVDGHNGPALDNPGLPRLDVRPLNTCDAPQGVRVGQSTYFPTGVVWASTWDPDLIRQVGTVLGEEARAMHVQLLYGPCINIHRTPQNGRFFENLSEDPYLTSTIGCAWIEGIQSEGVAACPKHFFGNDQEYGRHSFSSDMDERTMHEMDLRPFEDAVKIAHTWALMSSFNKVNGTFVAESKPYLTDLLRSDWNWDGLEVGDWGSIHDTAASMNAGLEMEMPDPHFYSAANLAASLSTGAITQATFDGAVKNVLRLMIRTGLADNPAPPTNFMVDSADQRLVAQRTAEEGITLLKNDHNILPLDRNKIKSIAVIGPNAQKTQLGGRWSADTPYFTAVSALEGITSRAGSKITVQYAQGCDRQTPAQPSDIQAAVDLASKCDVAVVVVGTDKEYIGEEADPPDLYLPGDQDKLIAAVAAANKNTIVVLNAGIPVLMDKWIDQVPGLVDAWYSGEEQGDAIAGILFGDINPSGKLPDTIAARREDYSDWPNYPGTDGKTEYAEGIFVGYRHFDKANITPLFPFGYGLSYTTFGYSQLLAPKTLRRGKSAMVRLSVKNTGKVAGDEVVELYVRDLHPQEEREVRELEGFQRVHLAPGQSATVSIPIDQRSFEYWDVTRHTWKADPGDYAIDVGASSRDIRLSSTLRLQ